MADPPALGTLEPGSASFRVEEIPAYAPSGSGEHLYVEVEAEGLTTDATADALARACDVPRRDVGFAGRKDRHAITRQWLSVRRGREECLESVASRIGEGRLSIQQVGRHRNKLRLGHLRGNRFWLRLSLREGASAALEQRLAALAHDGIPNRFGPQRFGVAGSNLEIARAWSRGEAAGAAALLVDPTGAWHPGDPLPDRGRGPFQARAVSALRKHPDDPARALRAAGNGFRQLIASAAQSAVFNAILDARRGLGLLHTLRAGDLAQVPSGATFLCQSGDLEDANRRAAPGTLEAFTTGPLPGWRCPEPGLPVLAEEKSWSAPAHIEWAWFGKTSPLASPGERRPLVIPFLEPPQLEPEAPHTWLRFALPRGSYATELLTTVGLELPDRSR